MPPYLKVGKFWIFQCWIIQLLCVCEGKYFFLWPKHLSAPVLKKNFIGFILFRVVVQTKSVKLQICYNIGDICCFHVASKILSKMPVILLVGLPCVCILRIRASWWLFTLRVRDLWQTIYILHVIVLYLFSKTNLNNHVPSSKWNVYTPVVRSVLVLAPDGQASQTRLIRSKKSLQFS